MGFLLFFSDFLLVKLIFIDINVDDMGFSWLGKCPPYLKSLLFCSLFLVWKLEKEDESKEILIA